MPTYTAKTSGPGPFYVDLIVNPGAQSVPGNYTAVAWSLRARSTGGSPTWSGDSQSWSVNIGGYTYSGTWVLDFRSTSLIIVAGRTTNVVHNVDGTRVLSSSGTLTTNHSNFGSGTAGGTLTLDRIPRGPKVRYNGAWRDTIAFVKDGATWRQAVPYVKSGASWKPAG